MVIIFNNIIIKLINKSLIYRIKSDFEFLYVFIINTVNYLKIILWIPHQKTKKTKIQYK